MDRRDKREDFPRITAHKITVPPLVILFFYPRFLFFFISFPHGSAPPRYGHRPWQNELSTQGKAIG